MAITPQEQHTESLELPADIGHGPSGFPPFESANFASELVWLAISFGLLYYLMSKIALPRVQGILDMRAGKIAQDLKEAHASREQSEQAAAAHDKTIAEAKAEAQALAQATHARLNAETEAKRHKLEADLNTKLADAEAQIANMKAKALGNVDDIAREAAASIVERLTGKAANAKAIAAAVADKA